MAFEELSDFIQNRMKMSHIYQPVMLMTLLKSSGSCHESEIATSILQHDQSQIDYYTNITNQMVGKVLRKHELVERLGKNYSLVGFNELSPEQINALLDLCQSKLDDYLEDRGDNVWTHRKKSLGYLSGTIKYEILKRAKFRCELCGISAEDKALEVDHITPRNHGGNDEQTNLQALCYSCNAMKRDRDDTDFRSVRESYSVRDPDCLFCNIYPDRVVAENELFFVVRDKYPVTPLHSLIVPKRHVQSYFELGQAEINASTSLLKEQKLQIINEDKTVSGFNLGVNDGESAGQTIFHCHIHLIPRRDRDVNEPSGGIRHTIPGKGCY